MSTRHPAWPFITTLLLAAALTGCADSFVAAAVSAAPPSPSPGTPGEGRGEGSALPATAPATLPSTHRTYPHAAVAADHALASAAGAQILKAGGNAVDAAVATSFTLSVVRPYSCGIGGGGFMIICFRNDPKHANKTIALNYRETAPSALTPDFYLHQKADDASSRGATSVGVPGTVAGLLHALDTYGTMDRKTVLAPAIRAAEEGFLVDAHYFANTRALDRYFKADATRQQRFPFVYNRFLNKGNLKIGHRIRLPEQATLLRLIADQGAAAFYSGDIAAAIARAVQSDNGPLTLDDLRQFKVAETQPLSFTAFNRTFLTMPPPSSGGVALAQTLGILQRLNIDQALKSNDEPAYIHLTTEALKHAFADRARWMGDPAFVNVPVQQLLSSEYLDARTKQISPSTTRPVADYGTHPPDDAGTSHFCVIDPHGNAVACTETINTIFGSLVAVPEYGFVLNNELDDFTARPGKPNAFGLIQSPRNAPAPGKRPLSSMTPTIVLDGQNRVELIAGAAGGPRIITGTLQIILNCILRNEDAPASMARPRFHHQWMPDELLLESPLRAGKIEEELKRRGHKTAPVLEGIANAQLIKRSPDGWQAACDPRKGGSPAGN